jgi:protein-tyrosine-phosphatase
VCETNGLQSPMAEALLIRIDSEHFEAVSAGTSPRPLHPYTVEVMKEVGIDLSQKTPKHMKDLKRSKFDYVITFDENSRRVHGNFQCAEEIHWQLDEPIVTSSDPERQLHAFRIVRNRISQRIRLFVIVSMRLQTKSLSAA